MEHDEGRFNELMTRVRGGSQEAARELFDEFGGHILRVVRRRLHRRLRPQFDSLDFAQDVWASFFADLPADEAFRTPEDLVSFLTRLARNKVVDVFRQRTQTHKYNVLREEPLVGVQLLGAFTRDPTPSEVAIGQEAWDRLLRGRPPVHRRILVLLREGRSMFEIAQDLGVSPRTVQRVVRAAWKKAEA